MVLSERARGNRQKLKHKRCPLNIRKHFATVRVAKTRHRLSKEVVESPYSEILKNYPDTILGNWL